MRHDKDNDWLDPHLAKQVGRPPVEFDFDQWAKRYPEEARLLEQGYGHSSRNDKTLIPMRWRHIMESKVTRFSAAAVVVFALGLVLLNPSGRSRQGVLLAAQERMAQVDTMVLKGQKVFTAVDDPNASISLAVTKYISRQYGYMEQGSVNGKVVYRVVMNMPEKQGLLAFGLWFKRCVKYPCAEGQIQLMEKLTPTGIVDMLLQTDHKELGRAKINGVDVEGFELHGVGHLKDVLPKALFDLQQGTATAWVSTESHLPVRLEGDLRIGKSLATFFLDARLHETTSLEAYNVELEPSLFSTEIPEGYSEFKLIDVLSTGVGLPLPGKSQ
jgi:hypothetical protein